MSPQNFSPALLADCELVGIRAISSVHFVREVLRAYEQGRVVTVLKDGLQPNLPAGATLAEIVEPAVGGGWLEEPYAPRSEDTPAQISFTSGTTGASKAIVLSHRALGDTVSRLNRVMRVTHEIREYVGVPVTYSFGLGRCRAVLAANGRCYLPEGGFNPAEIARMLRAGEINAISAVPTLWRTVLDDPDIIGDAGSRVRWIEIGSQYMSREEKERMKALFPNAVIVQHYGLTEASRSTFLEISAVEGEALESVGRPVGDTELSVSADGRICIRGPHVASAQASQGELQTLVDEQGWLRTNDLGELRDGFLYFGGRADDLINCGGVKLHPEEFEQRLRAVQPDLGPFAVCRVPDPLRGDGIFVAVQQPSEASLEGLRKVAKEVALELGVNAGSSVHVQTVEAIPTTDTGKPRRVELAKKFVAVQYDAGDSAHADPVLAAFAKMFPGEAIDEEVSFTSLGGDSLNYIRMTVLLERHLGSLPMGWEQLSVRELRGLAQGPQRGPRIEANVLLRAIAIIVVVGRHAGFIIGGGSVFLLLSAGLSLARFQSTRLFQGEIAPTLWTYARKILLAYWALTIPFLIYKRAYEPDLVLLYGNYVEGHNTSLFMAWFIQILMQCLLIVGLLLSFAPVRRWLSQRTWEVSFGFLLLLVAARAVIPLYWDTEYIQHEVPHYYLPLFWLGWCVHFAQTRPQKLLTALVSAGFGVWYSVWWGVLWWLTFGTALLLFVPTLPFPRSLRRVVESVAEASYYIYLLHLIFMRVLEKLWPSAPAGVALAVGLLGSFASWYVLDAQRLPQRLFGWWRDRRSEPAQLAPVSAVTPASSSDRSLGS